MPTHRRKRSHGPQDQPRLTAHAFQMTLVVQGNKLPQINYNYLRVLGSPNPGQSFGRGQWGPQATEVKIPRSASWAQKCEEKIHRSRDQLEFGRLRDASDLAASGRVQLIRFSEFCTFFLKVQFFSIFKIRSGIWILAASGTQAIWVAAWQASAVF